MIDLFAKLSPSRGINIVLMVWGGVVAPFWFIFQYAPLVYKTNDLLKLLILSAAIGAPVFMAVFLGILMFKANRDVFVADGSDDERFAFWGFAGGVSALVFYAAPFIDFCFSKTSSLREAIFRGISAYIGVIIGASILSVRIKRQKKRSI